LQGLDVFVDGMDNIVTTQKRVAKMYFDDGSIAQACPPLKALLHIMLHDTWEGKGLGDPEFRKMFTRESLLAATGMRRGWRRSRRLTGSCGGGTWSIWTSS
jgi:phosphoenolpyruvate carboxykinase (diphosphate)